MPLYDKIDGLGQRRGVANFTEAADGSLQGVYWRSEGARVAGEKGKTMTVPAERAHLYQRRNP